MLSGGVIPGIRDWIWRDAERAEKYFGKVRSSRPGLAYKSPYNSIFISPTTFMDLCSDQLLFSKEDYSELMGIHVDVISGKERKRGNITAYRKKQYSPV